MLKDKIQTALDELRMLVLGLQVLIGFGYSAVLSPGFDRLPHSWQLIKLAALSLLLISFGLVLTPAAEHRIYEHGNDTPSFHRLTTAFASMALLPFAVALSLDYALATFKALGPRAALIAPGIVVCVALVLWYGIELFARADRESPSMNEEKPASIQDKIHHVLTETRVVLPGAQALLGFQFAGTLTDGFDRLPDSMKALHLASLSAVALSTVLLITPAAWHRLVEHGEATEEFHRFASAMLLLALVPLALGLAGDFFLVADKITGSWAVASVLVAVLFVVYFVLWFGIGLARRGVHKVHGRLSRTPG